MIHHIPRLSASLNLTCLVGQSMVLAVSFVLYEASCPWCTVVGRLIMNDVSFPDWYLEICSIDLVQRVWEDSPMYKDFSLLGHSWPSIS